MKKVHLFEVIGMESHLGCYFSDLNAIFKSVESVSGQQSYPVYNGKTAKADFARMDNS